LDAAKVRVATTGAVYVGSLTAPPPSCAASAIPAGYADTGYIGEDGITETYDENTEDIKAWQGGQIVRRVISESSATLNFTMIESKRTTLELYHKGSTITSNGDAEGFRLDVKPPVPDQRRFILDVIDGTSVERIYVPLGEVTERGDITYANADVVGYEVTITCYPSDGIVMTKFSNDPAWAAA
jgi:hypothetical protein